MEDTGVGMDDRASPAIAQTAASATREATAISKVAGEADFRVQTLPSAYAHTKDANGACGEGVGLTIVNAYASCSMQRSRSERRQVAARHFLSSFLDNIRRRPGSADSLAGTQIIVSPSNNCFPAAPLGCAGTCRCISRCSCSAKRE